MKRFIFVCLLCSIKIFGEFVWTLPAQIISDLTADAEEAKVKMNDYGNVLCIYLDEGIHRLRRTVSLDYGVSWVNVANLVTIETHVTTEFSFDINNLGDAAIIFTTASATRFYSAYSSDFGISWEYSLIPAGIPKYLDLAINDNKIGLFSFSEIVLHEILIYDTDDGGATWNNEYATDITKECHHSNVAINNNNEAVSVYSLGAEFPIDLVRVKGVWNGSEFGFTDTEMVIASNIGNRSKSKLKMNDIGFVLYALQNDTGILELHSTNAGTTFSSSTLINNSSASDVQCDIDDSGYGIVTWILSDGTHNRIVERHTIDYGNSWSDFVYLSQAGQNAYVC